MSITHITMTHTSNDQIKWIDYHCHCLPAIDQDGTSDCDEAARIIIGLADQGVVKIYATPHFSLHDESPESFNVRRAIAYERLCAHSLAVKFPQIVLGAEINVQRGLSDSDLSPILSGSKIALFELPYFKCKRWMIDEIENVVYQYNVIPMIAHIERYSHIDQMLIEALLSLENVVFQVNCNAFNIYDSLKFLTKLSKSGCNFVFGSDAHNIVSRPPNFDIISSLYNQKGFLINRKRAKASQVFKQMINFQNQLESICS
ncbi:MAG: capsular polysaccharide biosynthesis protein [Clostridiales bacterium]|nr:capsular polysaccharide biosynthesis protein [Clostridiales bacterium]